MTPTERLTDLMRQGFMKPRRGSVVKAETKAPPPIVACNACLNWHRKGKHTASVLERKANRKRLEANRK